VHCYYHPATDAVAICKNCHRGLCPNCAVDMPNGMACRDRCEGEVQALDRLVQSNKTYASKAAATYVRSGVVLILLGLLLGAWGVSSKLLAIGAMGAIAVIGGIVQILSGRRFTGGR
jgi:hypothetical protein